LYASFHLFNSFTLQYLILFNPAQTSAITIVSSKMIQVSLGEEKKKMLTQSFKSFNSLTLSDKPLGTD